MQKQFFQAASLFLWCRSVALDRYDAGKPDNHASLGEMDWIAEMRLILKEWKRRADLQNKK